jgi:hypothetical protein
MAEYEIRGYCSTRDDVVRAAPGKARGAALAGKTWDTGKTLRVLFLDGPSEYHDRVEDHVKTWEHFADIKFACTNAADAEIRLTFANAPGCFYSMVGNDALLGGFPPDNHTMNLGILPSWPLGTDAVEREIRRLILHEFGHSLGLIHEHSSPEAGSFFKDPELVYEYYRQTQGWDREMVDQNVLLVYSRGQISNSTEFDPDSIMLYQFPPEITNRPTKTNYELSRLDEKLIGELYPKPGVSQPEDRPVPPTIETADPGRLLEQNVPLKVVHGLMGTQDLYRFQVAESGVYQVETTGDYGWVITLFQNWAQPEVIETTSGSEQGLKAKISRLLEPGTYYVAVRPFLPDGIGAYGIGVQRNS